jgi:peptide/nickel transport system substrate-binding protein
MMAVLKKKPRAATSCIDRAGAGLRPAPATHWLTIAGDTAGNCPGKRELSARPFFLFLFLSLSLLLAACSPQPAPTAAVTGPAASAVPTHVPATVGPGTPSPLPAASATPAPPPTPAPLELVVCQTGEPSSLYLYGDDVTARAGIFQALFDGPVDSVGYGYQPVLLTALPSLEAGTAGMDTVDVSPGDKVVDAVTGLPVPLAPGVQLAQADGSVITYTGTSQAHTVQVWAQFSLRSGVRWSDGAPLTADDSVFSYEIASAVVPGQTIGAGNKYVANRTAAYIALDPQQTRWTGLPGWLDNNFFLRFWTPLPRHLYGSDSAAQLLSLPAANDRPLGWGPFMFGDAASGSGWVKGASLTLVRNPNYFRASEGLPRLDKITFRFGLDAPDLLSEMQAGRCDLAGDDVDWSSLVPQLLQAKQAGTLAPSFVADNVFEHLDFGITPASDYKRPAGSNLFQDVHLRQAVAYCLDRQTLISQLVNGLSEVPASYVPSAHPDFGGQDLMAYAFDPAQGQNLLAEAGWNVVGADGVRLKGKLRLSLSLVSAPADDPFRQALLAFIQGQLMSNCGIEVKPNLLSADDLYAQWPDGLLFGRHFDLGTFPWRTGSEPPCELYLSDAIPGDENPGGANDTGYSSQAFDTACRVARRALDGATRHQGQVAAQVVFMQDLPSLPLFFRPKIAVARPSVSGLQLDSTAGSILWNVESLGLTRE